MTTLGAAITAASPSATDADGWLVLGGLTLVAAALLVGVITWRSHRPTDEDDLDDHAPKRSESE